MSSGLKLARSLAKVNGVSWEKVHLQLFAKCPQQGDHGHVLSNRNQEAVLALGIFFLESGFKHEDKILGYLLSLVRNLASASFPDELPFERSSKLPPAEIFSFSLITLLNDVASHHPSQSQVKFLIKFQVIRVMYIINVLSEISSPTIIFNTWYHSYYHASC